MLTFKDDVLIGTSHALCEILKGISAFGDQVHTPIMITSVSEGVHMKGSKHYTFQAVDVASKLMPKAVKSLFVPRIKELLGPQFDAFIESEGLLNEHFHVQVRKGWVYRAPTQIGGQ
jgi:hypothetical protein